MKRKPKLPRRYIKTYRSYKIVTDVYSRGLIRCYDGLYRRIEYKSPFWHLGENHRQMWHSSFVLNLFMLRYIKTLFN